MEEYKLLTIKEEFIMVIELMDYQSKKVTFDIGNIEDIVKIVIEVLTGDEVATVLYRNYNIKKFDSSCDRLTDYHDYRYIVYDAINGINLLNDEIFLNREDTYDLERKVMEW